jgi:hypothetical protein
MDRLEMIKLIGDLLTSIDVFRGSLLPDDPRRMELDILRHRLDGQQLVLSQNQFNDDTEEYRQASEKVAAINTEVKQTLNDITRFTTTIKNLTRLVGAVDTLVGIAVRLLA